MAREIHAGDGPSGGASAASARGQGGRNFHFFLGPDGEALSLKSLGRTAQDDIPAETLWPIFIVTRRAGDGARGSVALVVGTDPRGCVACHYPPEEADVPSMCATARTERVLELLREHLSPVFERVSAAECAPHHTRADDHRCAVFLDRMKKQTSLLAGSVPGSSLVLAPMVGDLPPAPCAHDGVEAHVLPTLSLPSAAACAAACAAASPASPRPLLVVVRGSAAHAAMSQQSTLARDEGAEGQGAVLITGMTVFRQSFSSATPGDLASTWLPSSRPAVPGHVRPSAWFPGSQLVSPFEVDVALLVGDGERMQFLAHLPGLWARKAGGADLLAPVVLDEALPAAEVTEIEKCWTSLPHRRLFIAAPSRARVPDPADERTVSFTLPFFTGRYTGRLQRAPTTLATACQDALARHEELALPFVPWETVLDEYLPHDGATQRALDWFSFADPGLNVVFSRRVSRSYNLRPNSRQAIPQPPQPVRILTPERLVSRLRGRVRPGAGQSGLGFVLDPLIWWSLAKSHYDPRASEASFCITRNFFPLSTRAWIPVVRGAPENHRAQVDWGRLLGTADNNLASQEGRQAIFRSWQRLLSGPLGNALIRFLDESVTHFVTVCAEKLLLKGEREVRPQIENLQKILFTFEGFVPLQFCTWDPHRLEELDHVGVVPHSHPSFLRNLVSTLRRPDSDGLLPTGPVGKRVPTRELTLLKLLSAPFAPVDAGEDDEAPAVYLARLRGTALSYILRDMTAEVFPSGAAPCSVQSELAPAVLFFPSSPMPHLLRAPDPVGASDVLTEEVRRVRDRPCAPPRRVPGVGAAGAAGRQRGVGAGRGRNSGRGGGLAALARELAARRGRGRARGQDGTASRGNARALVPSGRRPPRVQEDAPERPEWSRSRDSA